jgi:putative ABC transport system permease protein
MIRRIPGDLGDCDRHRAQAGCNNDHIPVGQTGGIGARRRPACAGRSRRTRRGTWFNAATASFPTVVLGSAAAHRLGISTTGTQTQVWLGGRWFTVIGLLGPVALAPELDAAALIGWTAAQGFLGFDGHPTTVYCRVQDARVRAVRDVLAATANPAAPAEVRVSRPSDALAATQATDATLTRMLLGLGAVALVVGGVGVGTLVTLLEPVESGCVASRGPGDPLQP